MVCFRRNIVFKKEGIITKRKVEERLLAWKKDPFHKPLLLQGARQVGKTYSVLAFGREHYENVAYFNFEQRAALRETFDEDLSPSYLLPILAHISGQTIIPGKTLIVFDEIQRCDKALTALKYFCEEAPEQHVIAMGSLLGVAVNREQFAFPVGKVNLMTMRPMDFEEFLWGVGEEELAAAIRDAFEASRPLPAVLHQTAMERYRQYLVVGGMPECVSKFAATGDYLLVRSAQDDILIGYLDDMSKYNTKTEIRRTRLTYDNITVQLSRTNTRFQYKLLKKGGRAAEFEHAIEWLVLSGIVSQVYRAEQVKKPLDNYRDIDAFKIYVSDPGLLTAKKDLHADDILYGMDLGELDDFKGGMVENYVNTQLVANGYRTYYWESEEKAEIDFLIQRGGDIIPIEVKAADHTRSKSLAVYRKRFNPAYAVRLSQKNFGFEEGLMTIPLYAAFCL